MRKWLLCMLPAAALLSGCATKDGWKGAEAEKAYDKELEAMRLASEKNNNDYYEILKDGRVSVISDAKDYREYKKSGEIPLRVTKIGGGLNGETVVFGLTKKEAKAMEKKVGFMGGAQNLYERKVDGLAKGFYGQIETDDKYFVFGDWRQMDAYRKGGTLTAARTDRAPDGKTVIFASADEELAARFRSLHAQ